MPIILFDIDGTLVRTGGAGKLAMESALVSAFGVTELRDVVKYSGRTDTAITRDLLHVHGIDPTAENQKRLRDEYLARLPGSLTAKGGEVCPGVPELLAALAGKPGVVMGLLTGNVRAGADEAGPLPAVGFLRLRRVRRRPPRPRRRGPRRAGGRANTRAAT